METANKILKKHFGLQVALKLKSFAPTEEEIEAAMQDYANQFILPFKDMHGKQVKIGDTIKIVTTYTHQFLQGQIATVIWDEKKGMYKYSYTDERRSKKFTTENDFYGIHEFEIIK